MTTNGDDDLTTNLFLSVMCVAPRPPTKGLSRILFGLFCSTCDHETGGSFHVAARSADSPLEIRFSERAPFSVTRSPSNVALARSRVCCACAPAFEGFFRPAVYERSLVGACHHMRPRYSTKLSRGRGKVRSPDRWASLLYQEGNIRLFL